MIIFINIIIKKRYNNNYRIINIKKNLTYIYNFITIILFLKLILNSLIKKSNFFQYSRKSKI